MKENKDISLDSSSFALIRTNPALTGNLKITVDSNGGIWLNTIDANAILANSAYKNYPIIDDWSHPMNVAKLFSTERDSVLKCLFDVRQDVDPSFKATEGQYENQFDFSEYFSGARYLVSNGYDERFSYFAPIYLNGLDVPEYFVILKIDGALNADIKTLDENKSMYDRTKYFNDILSKSTIIKTFNLKDDSRIGKYIRSMINNVNFPKCGLQVNFNKEMPTRWFGLNVVDGVYSDASEYLYDFYSEVKPLRIFERYITDGFKRHGLLYPNILNLEFLFDDETSDIFEHNRYVGFYVNENELTEIRISAGKQRAMQLKYGNTPRLYSDVNQLLFFDSTIENKNGIVLAADTDSSDSISEKIQDLFDLSDNDTIIPYIKDKNNLFHNIKEISYEDNKIDNIKLADRKLNFDEFVGSNGVGVINDYCEKKDTKGKSYIHIKFNELPDSGETLRIYHMYGSRNNETSFYDDISFTHGHIVGGGSSGSGSSGYTSSGSGSEPYGTRVDGYCGYHNSIITFDPNIDTRILDDVKDRIEYKYVGDLYQENADEYESLLGEIDGNYLEVEDDEVIIDGVGTLKRGNILVYKNKEYFIEKSVPESNINYFFVGSYGKDQHKRQFTEALAETINSIPGAVFTAYSNGYDELIIVHDEYGGLNDSFSVETDSKMDIVISGGEKIGNIVRAAGGTSNNNLTLIDSLYKDTITEKSVLRVDGGYSYITEVTRYAADFNVSMSEEDIQSAFDVFNNKIAVITKDDVPALTAGDKCFIADEFIAPIGLFSFYKVKDFDFDTHSLKYSTSTYWDNYKSKIPTNVKVLESNVLYKLVDDNGDLYQYNNISLVEEDNNATLEKLSGYFYISQKEFNNNKYSFDSDVELFAVPYARLYDIYDNIIIRDGVITGARVSYLVDDESRVIMSNPLTKNRTVSDLSNEYDYYSENEYNQLEYDGKLVGYICKWGYKNGTDCFGNPYRLNVHDSFGRNNLSPIESINIDIDRFSNSWPYIVSSAGENIQDNNCYINSAFDINNLSFRDYFRVESNGVSHILYSDVKYNENTGMCETFFRGKKIVFKEYDEKGQLIEDNNKYDGYVFSVLIVPKKIEYDPTYKSYPEKPIEYILKKNDKQKYILFYINVYLEDSEDNKISSNFERDTHVCESKYSYEGVLSDYFGDKEAFKTLYGYIVIDNISSDAKKVISDKFGIDELDGIKIGDLLICNSSEGGGIVPIFGSGSDVTDDIIGGKVTDYNCHYIIKMDNDEIYSFMSNLYQIEDGSEPGYKNVIDADHRIHFNSDGVCDLTYSDLYSFKSKKFDREDYDYATINIPTTLNISSTGSKWAKIDVPILFDSNLSALINDFGSGSPLVSLKNGEWSTYLMTYEGNIIPYQTMVNSDYNYVYSSYDRNDNHRYLTQFKWNGVQFVKNASYNQDKLFQVCGGYNYFSNNLFKKLSFGTIVRVINNRMYKNESTNGFIMEFDDTSVINHTGYMSITSDVYDSTEIGKNYEITSNPTSNSILSSNINLQRYSGKYEPVFNDVLYFTSDFDDDYYNYKFNTNVDEFGIIKNFNHLKVSIGDIYNNDLPLTSELTENTTIGYKDFDVLRTSWDLDFHIQYNDVKNSDTTSVPGTLRIEEDDTYINNIIKMPNRVRLTKFKVELVDDVNLVDMSDRELVYSVNNYVVSIRVNYYNVLIKKLRKLGIDKAFELLNVYNSEEEIDRQIDFLGMPYDDYVNKYIETNIMKLYDVNSSIVYYKKKEYSDKSMFDINEDDFDDVDKYMYVVDRNIKINNSEKFMADFTYHIRKDFNSTINFVLELKLI